MARGPVSSEGWGGEEKALQRDPEGTATHRDCPADRARGRAPAKAEAAQNQEAWPCLRARDTVYTLSLGWLTLLGTVGEIDGSQAWLTGLARAEKDTGRAWRVAPAAPRRVDAQALLPPAHRGRCPDRLTLLGEQEAHLLRPDPLVQAGAHSRLHPDTELPKLAGGREAEVLVLHLLVCELK